MFYEQANGLDERRNQTVKNMLVKFVGTRKETWDEYLDHCVFVYNTSHHESSLYSPFEVMFGRKATIPIELEQMKEGSQLLVDYLLEPKVIQDCFTMMCASSIILPRLFKASTH